MSLEELSGPALRRHIEATIEALIAQLDDLDGDSDAEPSLGWPEARTGITPGGYDRSRRSAPACVDPEYDECEVEEGEDLEGDELDALEGDPDEDKEPALGWNAEASQAHLMGGVSAYEDEPSLAASNPSGLSYVWPRGLQGMWRSWWGSSGDASQEHWGDLGTGQIDAEEEHDGREPENEHGGDVQDEPHDAQDEDTGIADKDALMAEDFWPAMASDVRKAQILAWRNGAWSTAKTIDGEDYRFDPVVSSSLPGLPAL